MKKYITPAVEINETEAIEMMALSLQDGTANSSEVLTKEEEYDWDVFSEED